MSEHPKRMGEIGEKDFSIAVFPFLKTSDPIELGAITFRSTDDVAGLPKEQASAVRDIAEMLFLQDDFRIKSGSYSIVSRIDLERPGRRLDDLVRVQAAVAYCYACPRHEFGDLFLSPEHASLVVLTPGRVPAGLTRPDFHVERSHQDPAVVSPGDWLDGYMGLFGLRHPFWVVRGSRLYGPMPHMTLNISQNLSRDLDRACDGRADYRLLLDLLRRPDGPVATRVFAAVRWFNSANRRSNDDAEALVDLSIAFETLLQLPRDEKTSRLTDAVSLLLGRTPRLDEWARQFYEGRSCVAHEGRAAELHFFARSNGDKKKGAPYQTLISYGRQVFELCVGTILAGAELASHARLEEKFVTNQERFEHACKLLDDATLGPEVRLERISGTVSAIRDYLYVPEPELRFETMLGACRRAASCWLDCDAGVSEDGRALLVKLANTTPSKDLFPEMEALAGIEGGLRDGRLPAETDTARTARDLLQAVWRHVLMHYFRLKQQRSRDDAPQQRATD